MRDYKEYLYICLMEECAEVTKEVSKILRFGEQDYSPSDPNKTPNIERLNLEVIDLLAVMEMCVRIDPDTLDELVKKKVEKVNRYYAISEGTE